MVIKTYKANTNISINVMLANKKNFYLTFTPLSNGSSTFTTGNEDIQNAIERHYKYGKLFRLHSVQGQSEQKAAKAVEMPTAKAAEDTADAPVPATADNVTTTDNEEVTTAGGAAVEASEQSASVKKVNVSDIAAAKDYLADTFGISRTALRTTKVIMEQAATHGIVFEGLS